MEHTNGRVWLARIRYVITLLHFIIFNSVVRICIYICMPWIKSCYYLRRTKYCVEQGGLVSHYVNGVVISSWCAHAPCIIVSSPHLGFKSKRLLDADVDERVVLVANTFEHKVRRLLCLCCWVRRSVLVWLTSHFALCNTSSNVFFIYIVDCNSIGTWFLY